MKKILLLSALVLPLAGVAQVYSISWHKIAGGGGTSSGGSFQVSGTVGQSDAGSPMSGGSYSVTGGFWSLIAAVQSTGMPLLTITQSGANVTVSWANTGTFTLQSSGSLASGAWTNSNLTISTANGTNSVTVSPLRGSLFFRLMQ